MVEAHMVVTPKGRMALVDVLYDSGANADSLVLLRWYEKETGWYPTLGMRWNGTPDPENKGFPTTRGRPTWYVVPEHLYRAVLTSEKIPPSKKALAEEVLHLNEKRA